MLVLSTIIGLSIKTLDPTIQKTAIAQHASTPANIILRDETLKRGINFVHSQTSKNITGLDESLGSGACAFDMDNDHDMDLYLVGGSGQQRFYGKKSWWTKKTTGRLYQNNGGGNFVDVTVRSGLDFVSWGMGCNNADFDHDGLIDLLVTGREHNELFKNLGDGKFAPIKLDETTQWSTSAAIGDYNNDGWMDIYVGNYLNYDKTARNFESLSGYDSFNAQFKPENYPAVANQLYTNLGGMSFKSDAPNLNILNADGRTLSAKWLDANNDRWLDLLVLNDTGSSSQLYLNINGLSFEKANKDRLGLPEGARDAAIHDYDYDGDADIIFSTQLGASLVLLNNKNGNYQNSLWKDHRHSELFSGYSGYGLQFVDLNNDGNLDIFHGQGLNHPDTDAPAISTGQPDTISLATNHNFFLPASGNSINPSYEMPWLTALSTRSVIAVDIDNDGDKDMLITSNNNPTRLLINHAPISRWIGLELVDQFGNHGNYQKITIGTNYRSNTFFANNDTFLGRSDDRVSLSLKDGERIENITIDWRNGETSNIPPPEENTYYTIQQGNEIISEYTFEPSSITSDLPVKLAIWQVKSGQFNASEILLSFENAIPSAQQELISTISSNNNSQPLLPILKSALDSNNSKIVIAAIAKLKKMEVELSYYWLENLLYHPDPNIICAATNSFRQFYIEEEAFIQRKYLAIPHLLRLLKHSNNGVVTCVILALAESKSVRAAEPIERLLLSNKAESVQLSATFALTKLPHFRSLGWAVSRKTSEQSIVRANVDVLQLRHLSELELSDKMRSKHLDKSEQIDSIQCLIPPPETLINFELSIIANQFKNCPKHQLRKWLELHNNFVQKNLTFFFKDLPLDNIGFVNLVEYFSRGNDPNIVKLLLTQLHQQTHSTRRLILIKALEKKLPNLAVEKVLKHMLNNKINSKTLRIAAGDALIDHSPNYVMTFATELFNE